MLVAVRIVPHISWRSIQIPKIKDRENLPLFCTTCRCILGYTAPGEAERIKSRAALYCEDCVYGPANLTDRQLEVIRVTAALRAELGQAPKFTEIGASMDPPLTRSRIQALVGSIRLRGHGDELDEALYGPMVLAEQTAGTIAPGGGLLDPADTPKPEWADVKY